MMINLLFRTDTINVRGLILQYNDEFFLFFNFRKLNQDLLIGLIMQMKKSPKLEKNY